MSVDRTAEEFCRYVWHKADQALYQAKANGKAQTSGVE